MYGRTDVGGEGSTSRASEFVGTVAELPTTRSAARCTSSDSEDLLAAFSSQGVALAARPAAYSQPPAITARRWMLESRQRALPEQVVLLWRMFQLGDVVSVMIDRPPANAVTVMAIRHDHNEPQKTHVAGYQPRQSTAPNANSIRYRFGRIPLASGNDDDVAEGHLPRRTSEEHSKERPEHQQHRFQHSTNGRARRAQVHQTTSPLQDEGFDLAEVNQEQHGIDGNANTEQREESSVSEMLDAWLKENHLKQE
nr:hypothetical protein CFP56_21796 [Quercus suber]